MRPPYLRDRSWLRQHEPSNQGAAHVPHRPPGHHGAAGGRPDRRPPGRRRAPPPGPAVPGRLAQGPLRRAGRRPEPGLPRRRGRGGRGRPGRLSGPGPDPRPPAPPEASDVAGSLASMLAARTGLSPVMVGRADELARLRELVATTGDPAVAPVGGEAGIGKTRLVAELVATLPRPCRCWPARAAGSILLKGPFFHT